MITLAVEGIGGRQDDLLKDSSFNYGPLKFAIRE